MFTLATLYVTLYAMVLLGLFALCFTQIPFYLITNLSMSTLLIFLQKYTNTKNIFLMFILILSGLPPFGFFFIKFNIFIFLLYQVHFFTIIVLFLMFLINMLFYLQIFNNKNFNKPLYSIINTNLFTNLKKESSITCNLNSYRLYLFLINILLLSVLAISFISDLFLVFML